jgi:uncharacterized protein (TIRG00374 family)
LTSRPETAESDTFVARTGSPQAEGPPRVDLPPYPEAPPEPADGGPEEVSLRKRFLNFRTLISFAFAVAIIVFLLTRFDINLGDALGLVARANPLLFLAALLIYYATFPVRGLRWRFILHNAGFAPHHGVRLPSVLGLSQIILLGWFANTILVAKLGDVYRGYLLKRSARVSFSKTVGTIFAERLIDMLVLFGLLVIAAVGVARTTRSEASPLILEVGVVMSLLIVAGLLAMRFLGGTIHRFVPGRLQALYLRFQDGTLSSFGRLPALVTLSIIIWLAESARLYLVIQAVGISVPLPLILFAALANSLLTAVPFTPGGLGLVEAGLVAILVLAPMAPTEAAGIALLDRVISYWSVIVFGFLLQVFGPHR